jgi:ubiquinone/menaquinone biosynthesis C-methylase UbiE
MSREQLVPADAHAGFIDLKWFLSAVYSHLANRTFSLYWQARQKIVFAGLELQSADRVLEIGCGAGPWTSYIAPRVQSMTALDVAARSLTLARRWKSPRRPHAPTAHVAFVQTSAVSLPFDSAAFTKLLLVDVLEHIPDDASALREAARVLAPGGVLVLTTLLCDRPAYLRRMQFPDHAREYTLGRLLSLLADAGLVARRVHYFYHAPTLIARELQVALEQTPLGRPGIDLLSAPLLRALGSIESLLHVGQPAGIGLVAVRAHEGIER